MRDWIAGFAAEILIPSTGPVVSATIRPIEEGPVMGYASTLMSIQSAFEQAGIRGDRFAEDNSAGSGVQLEKKPRRR